jgi:hypothetical protein
MEWLGLALLLKSYRCKFFLFSLCMLRQIDNEGGRFG